MSFVYICPGEGVVMRTQATGLQRFNETLTLRALLGTHGEFGYPPGHSAPFPQSGRAGRTLLSSLGDAFASSATLG